MGEKEKGLKRLKKRKIRVSAAIVPVVFSKSMKSLQIVKCGVGGGGADVAFTLLVFVFIVPLVKNKRAPQVSLWFDGR